MTRWRSLCLAAALTAGPGAGMAAQQAQPAAPVPAAPAQPAPAKEADGASVDSLVAALYDVISGPAGAPRNWNRMRALFAPDAKLMVVTPNREGGYALRALTVEDYISRNMSAFSRNGFYEREIARTTEAFGQLAHVFSTYELLRSPNDPKPFMRGINSIQLAHDGKRWWIANLVWRAEDAGLALPERYLQSRPETVVKP
ncbi:hypothetical protein ACFPOU_09910 [Massilia jejuensis]|uniref:SnoaL-like protein n=1 Tax=Massilia jejuensis TaxID=648894 RepID=A0ABW0PH76_9BURK